MEIKAEIILDSMINGVRVTTFELTLPKFILAELNTHRVFSRSTASARAIPNKKIMELVKFEPDYFRANCKGMQPKEKLRGFKAFLAYKTWRMARRFAILFSRWLNLFGVHKELCNRLIEPFMYCKTVLTATKFKNFFELRTHEDAQYEMRKLARLMEDLYVRNKPKARDIHLPFITSKEFMDMKLSFNDKITSSVARCARVSYVNHGGETDFDADQGLFNRLLKSDPMHSSPAEHIVMSPEFYGKYYKMLGRKKKILKNLNGNLHYGVVQYRKVIENSQE